LEHRRAIDGLRAVAVLPVLFSHAGIALFSGGFVGVDVFFVISGFLITGIILDDLDRGRFSIWRFYERRARRILPALFLVMFATLVPAWFLMSADAFQNFGQSLVATTLFSNNVLLTLTSGYWDMEAAFKPLLHTWTLGVEEQYYIVTPVILILMHRFLSHHIGSAMAAIGVISLAACLWGAVEAPVANFYLLPFRAWELAVGGIAVVILRRRQTPFDSDALSALGVALIGAAIFGFGHGLPYPSLYTLLPVIGSALVLLYCRSGVVHAVLSSPPMVGIGLISYSAYLWHQPVFALMRVASPAAVPPATLALLIVPVLALSYLSWRFVEQPFRDRARVSLRWVGASLGLAAVVLIGAGLAIHHGGGLPQRFATAPGAEPPGSYVGFNSSVFRFKRDAFDRPRRKLLVIGNSTARDFVNMVAETGQFRDYEIVYRDDIYLCDQVASKAEQQLLEAATLVVVVLGEAWTPECNGHVLAAQPRLRGRIVFVGPRDFGVNINPYARLPLAERPTARVRLSDSVLQAERYFLPRTPLELYVNVISRLSADGRTVPVFDEAGRILSEDRVHLTRAGARFVGMRVFADPIWRNVRGAAEAREDGVAPAT
jgi:peptidoglycan/LPS O-acetylase OafA/YrhL